MSGSSQNRESPHFYIVILHTGAVLKDFMPYPAPDSVAADFLRAGDPVALRPELFRRNAGTHRTSRTALGSRRCDRPSRGRSRRFALLPTAAQKQHRHEDKGQSFYFHVRMFSFSAEASYAYHTINRSRSTTKRAAARKMRQRLFSAFQFSRVSAQDWQAVMRLIL